MLMLVRGLVHAYYLSQNGEAHAYNTRLDTNIVT